MGDMVSGDVCKVHVAKAGMAKDVNVAKCGRVDMFKGGFGKVFAGERLKDRLPVAIKHINKTKISSWCTVST